MDNDIIGTLNNNISRVEHKRLLELLEHYNIEADEIIRENNCFIITSGNDTYCLRRIKDNRTKTLRNIHLANYLLKNGFNNMPLCIKVKNDKELLKYNNSLYYLNRYIEGRESSYLNFDDIKSIALLLADFHLKSQGFYNKHIKTSYKTYNWSSKLLKYKEAFNKINDILANKKIKTMFDILYIKSIEFFEEQLELSVKLLNSSNYNRILQSSKLKYTICIDNFNMKKIIFGKDGNYYFTCLDNIKYNMNIFDLSKFIKKTLYKKEYSWNFKYAAEIINNYCTVNPLSKDEITILLSLIIFPKRFYKLGKNKYIKHKNWGEDKYLTNLYKVTKYIDKQNKFVEEFISYYSIM